MILVGSRRLCVLALFCVAPCWAGSSTEPGCIVAPGFAVAHVSPDVLTIDFALETAADSFQDGAAKARNVATELESMQPPLDGVSLSVSHDLTFMQQKKWTAGTKQRYEFRLTAEGIPDGKAHEAMVAIVESAVTRVANLTVTAFEARLSDSRTKQLHRKLLEDAIADSRDFAGIAAAAANLTMKSVRSLHVGGPVASERPYDLEEMAVVVRSYAGVVSGFKVHDKLESTIRVAVNVTVDYACEPK